MIKKPPRSWKSTVSTPTLDWEGVRSGHITLSDILLGPDPRYFFELFCKIPTQHGSKPFTLFPWMMAASIGVTPHEMMLKSREIGSSTLWVAEKVRKVLTNPGANLLIAADKEGNAINLMKYAKHIVMNLPEKIRPVIGKNNESTIEFPKLGNQIKALPGTVTSGRSERCKYLICTEMSFWDNPEEYWRSVTGALVEGGETVIESTANTESDLFHDMWFDEDNGYRKHFYGWQSNPTHTKEWYEQRKKEIPESFLFYREYPDFPEQAFQSSTDIYFDRDDISRGEAAVREPLRSIPATHAGNTVGRLMVWKLPLPGRHYVIGVDVAEGKSNNRGKPDYSNAKVLDWRTGEHVATLHCRLPDDLFAKELFSLGHEYNRAFMGVERNGPGLAVIRTLQALNYPADRFYYQESYNTGLQGSFDKTSNIGWLTTTKTKPVMIADLNTAIHAGELSSPDAGFWQEAKSFGRDLKAKGSAHDDQIMSMAIAEQARKAYRPGINQAAESKNRNTSSGRSWAWMFGRG